VLKIRLRRTGARKRPTYRLVVAESTAPRDGQFVEIIGFYDPLTDPATVRIDGDKAKVWLRKGAQPTERVARLLFREGLIEGGNAPWAIARPAPAVEEPPKKPRARRTRAKSAEPQAAAPPAEEPSATEPTAEATASGAPAE